MICLKLYLRPSKFHLRYVLFGLGGHIMHYSVVIYLLVWPLSLASMPGQISKTSLPLPDFSRDIGVTKPKNVNNYNGTMPEQNTITVLPTQQQPVTQPKPKQCLNMCSLELLLPINSHPRALTLWKWGAIWKMISNVSHPSNLRNFQDQQPGNVLFNTLNSLPLWKKMQELWSGISNQDYLHLHFPLDKWNVTAKYETQQLGINCTTVKEPNWWIWRKQATIL